MKVIHRPEAPPAIDPNSPAVALPGQAAGASLADVVKTTVFVTDLDEFARLDPLYGRRFGRHTPARSTVQVAPLPRDAKVEIEAIARLA
jgi:2-iminobutanoate/2-iminopropanoate deaminase